MAHQHPPRFLKIVDDAKSRVRETNVDEVKIKMDRGDKFGQCLSEIRNAEPYGLEAMKAIVSRCTSAFP